MDANVRFPPIADITLERQTVEMVEPPTPLKGKSRRLKSLNEFETPYWKGVFQPWRKNDVPNWMVVSIGFAAGAIIGLYVVVS